eukprot:m.211643 g.211643  ORF g.211643 m.211643 type:complete len:350 (-) comp18677_c0_seq1:286-1335(-)
MAPAERLMRRLRPRDYLLLGFSVIVLLLLAKRYVYFDIQVTEVYPCLLHGWSENENTQRKVWDAFPFDSELDILDARLHELVSVVDYFVIVEAAYTFSGVQKPLYYQDNKARFKEFESKIVHIVLSEFNPPSNVQSRQDLKLWREAEQKNAIMRGLAKADSQDLVIVSDLDEIPRAMVIAQLKRCQGYTLPVELHMQAFAYDFGCPLMQGFFRQWRKAKVVRRNQLHEVCNGPWDGMECVAELRKNQNLRLGFFHSPTSIANAGWHLSFFLPSEKVIEKAHANAHTDEFQKLDLNTVECMVSKCQHVNGDAGTRTSSGAAADGPSWTHEQAERGVPAYVQYYLRTLVHC